MAARSVSGGTTGGMTTPNGLTAPTPCQAPRLTSLADFEMLELPEVDVMPEQYEWGLWFSSQQNSLNHTYVYRRDVALQAGTTYHFQTRNLGSGSFGRPDPVMYLVRGNEIVEFNDDYTGLASEIIYTPTVTGTYRLV